MRIDRAAGARTVLEEIRRMAERLESDHGGVIATLGRPSSQAADTVLVRVAWRWANPTEPFGTLFDPPRLELFQSTARIDAP